jgi:hypothetical protein
MPLLPPHRDAMGSAIRDYHLNKTAKPIRILSSLFDEDKIPVPILFRTFDEMNQMEQRLKIMNKQLETYKQLADKKVENMVPNFG